nr:MAG TPA: hypothetical protein [Bacteriophage sp.]
MRKVFILGMFVSILNLGMIIGILGVLGYLIYVILSAYGVV